MPARAVDPANAPWSGFGFDMDFDSADVPSDEKIIYDLLSEGDLSTLPTANALPRMPSKDTQRLVKREFASSRQQSEHGPASTYNLSPDMLSSDVLEEIWMEAKRTKWTVAPRPPHESKQVQRRAPYSKAQPTVASRIPGQPLSARAPRRTRQPFSWRQPSDGAQQSASGAGRSSSLARSTDRKRGGSLGQRPNGKGARAFVFERKMGVQDLILWRANRAAALARYRAKKAARKANPSLCRYKIRKNIANKRPRIKGRFVKTTSLVDAAAATPRESTSPCKAAAATLAVLVKAEPIN